MACIRPVERSLILHQGYRFQLFLRFVYLILELAVTLSFMKICKQYYPCNQQYDQTKKVIYLIIISFVLYDYFYIWHIMMTILSFHLYIYIYIYLIFHFYSSIPQLPLVYTLASTSTCSSFHLYIPQLPLVHALASTCIYISFHLYIPQLLLAYTLASTYIFLSYHLYIPQLPLAYT